MSRMSYYWLIFLLSIIDKRGILHIILFKVQDYTLSKWYTMSEYAELLKLDLLLGKTQFSTEVLPLLS
jgi:hypothetical protein